MPYNERNRVHTSTVTVAVLEAGASTELLLNEDELQIQWYSGTGAGGQHRNKHQNSCRLKHTPTGIVVTAQCRSRQNSLEQAKAELLSRLKSQTQSNQAQAHNQLRKGQVGSGMRGDKIRTYRFQDDKVVDHKTGKSALCSKVMKGNFDLLWE